MTPPPSDDAASSPEDPACAPRAVPDPALLRLAQAMADLNPGLVRSLCLSGLAAMDDPRERESWSARLGSFLEEGPSFGAGPILPA